MISSDDLKSPTQPLESLDSMLRAGPGTATSGATQQDGSIFTTFQVLSASLVPTKPLGEAPPSFNLRGRAGSASSSSTRHLSISSTNSMPYTLFRRSTLSSSVRSDPSPSRETSVLSSGSTSLNVSITSEDAIRQRDLLRELEKAEDQLEQRMTEALNDFSEDPATQEEAKRALFALTNSGTKNLFEYWISVLDESLSLEEGSDQFKLENLLFLTTIHKREALGATFSEETKSFFKSFFLSLQDPLSKNRFSRLIAEKPELFTEPLVQETQKQLRHLQAALQKQTHPTSDPCGRENGILNQFLASLSPKYSWEAVLFLNTEGYFTGNFNQIDTFLTACEARVQDLDNTPEDIEDLEVRLNRAEIKIANLEESLSEVKSMIADRLEQLHLLETKDENEKLSLEKERQKIEEEKEHPDYQSRLQNWSIKYRNYLDSGPPFVELVSRRLKREIQGLENDAHILGTHIDSIQRDLTSLAEQLLLARKEQFLAEEESRSQQAETQTQRFHQLAKAAGLESLLD